MDRRQENINLHPRVREQIRDIKLRELAEKGMTLCDECGKTYKRTNALEVWSGSRLLYVICQRCVRKGSFTVIWKPTGYVVEQESGETNIGQFVGLMDPKIRPVME